MKLLLSAYACEPHKGSEPGVGWQWATELAQQGHEVHVLTRAKNRSVINKELAVAQPKNLHFHYYDLPRWLSGWKKGRRGIHLYYFLWQLGIYPVARSLARQIPFDVIHHVTFVSVRQPSFLGLLGVPFIFGPVAGGEHAPNPLRKSFPWRGQWIDRLRDLANLWCRYSPLMALTYASARKIYVTSTQSQQLIPSRFHPKTEVKLAIGSPPVSSNQLSAEYRGGPLSLLYAGQLLYWKGIHLALFTFSRLLQQSPDSRLTILGTGPEKQWLKRLAQQLSIDHAINWLSWLPRDEVDAVYQRHHLLLFPSLHDSGGMVVLEAMSHHLPVVCLDLGGPGVTVNNRCGYRINTSGRSETEVVDALVEALSAILDAPEVHQRLAREAGIRASQMSWTALVNSIYPPVNFPKPPQAARLPDHEDLQAAPPGQDCLSSGIPSTPAITKRNVD